MQYIIPNSSIRTVLLDGENIVGEYFISDIITVDLDSELRDVSQFDVSLIRYNSGANYSDPLPSDEEMIEIGFSKSTRLYLSKIGASYPNIVAANKTHLTDTGTTVGPVILFNDAKIWSNIGLISCPAGSSFNFYLYFYNDVDNNFLEIGKFIDGVFTPILSISHEELSKLGLFLEPLGNPDRISIPDVYVEERGVTKYPTVYTYYSSGNMFESGPVGITYSGSEIDSGEVFFILNAIGFSKTSTIKKAEITAIKQFDDLELSTTFNLIFGKEPSGPYDPGGISGPGGGGGSFDYPTPFDQIDDTPVGSAEADSSSLGIFTRYLMSQSSLTRFGDYLYSDNLIDAVVMELMKLLYSTPAEALISLISYPFNVASLLSSTPSNVFFGNGDTGIASDGRLTQTAAQVNWGSILVKGWTGSFLDFSPHTKFDLYLPWCTGTVSLDPSEILTDRSIGISGDVATGQIQIRTNIEIAKGTCMHMVYNGDGVCIGTYSGVCGSQLPITALDTSGKALAFVTAAVSAMVSGAAGAAGAAMAGMASAARSAGAISPISEASQLKQATLNGGHSPAVPNYSRGIAGAQAVSRGAAKVAVDSARAAAITPPSISRNGSFTANGSGMSIQYPYLIVSYPERDIPERYSNHYGYPSNIYKQLGSLSGYTEVAAIHLDGLSCTEPELSELDELLKGGVIL